MYLAVRLFILCITICSLSLHFREPPPQRNCPAAEIRNMMVRIVLTDCSFGLLRPKQRYYFFYCYCAQFTESLSNSLAQSRCLTAAAGTSLAGAIIYYFFFFYIKKCSHQFNPIFMLFSRKGQPPARGGSLFTLSTSVGCFPFDHQPSR